MDFRVTAGDGRPSERPRLNPQASQFVPTNSPSSQPLKVGEGSGPGANDRSGAQRESVVLGLLKEIEDEHTNKFELDERLFSAFNYVHENNFLALSSSTTAIGTPLGVVQQFWSHYNISTYRLAAHVASNCTVAECWCQVHPERPSWAAELPAVMAEFPLVAIRETLCAACSPQNNGEISPAEQKEAVCFSMLILYYYLRVAFMPAEPTMLDVERLVCIRENLYRVKESRAFIKCVVPMMLLSRVHTNHLRMCYDASFVVPPLQSILSVKHEFCSKFSKMVVHFMNSPPREPFQQTQVQCRAVLKPTDILMTATIGDVLLAFRQLKDKLGREEHGGSFVWRVLLGRMQASAASPTTSGGSTTPSSLRVETGPSDRPRPPMLKNSKIQVAAPQSHTDFPSGPVAGNSQHSATSSYSQQLATFSQPMSSQGLSQSSSVGPTQTNTNTSGGSASTQRIRAALTVLEETDCPLTLVESIFDALRKFVENGEERPTRRLLAMPPPPVIKQNMEAALRALTPRNAEHIEVVRSALRRVEQRIRQMEKRLDSTDPRPNPSPPPQMSHGGDGTWGAVPRAHGTTTPPAAPPLSLQSVLGGLAMFSDDETKSMWGPPVMHEDE